MIFRESPSSPLCRGTVTLSQVDYKVKTSLIWRLTHEIGLREWRKMDRSYLTPTHAAKRLSWALTYRGFTPED